MTRLFDEHGRPIQRQTAIVRHIDLQRTASLAAAAAEVDDFIVPASLSWLLQRSRIDVAAPPGAASGNHWCHIRLLGTFNFDVVAGPGAAHNVDLRSGDSLVGAVLGTGRTLSLVYHNGTNVAQTNPRNWFLTYREEAS